MFMKPAAGLSSEISFPAFWKTVASPKLITLVLTPSRGAQYHGTATFGTERGWIVRWQYALQWLVYYWLPDRRADGSDVGGWGGMACLELGDMLLVGLPTGAQSALLNGVENPINVGIAQDGGGLSLDIADQAAAHDVVRHGGLEGAVANKIDDGVQLMICQSQQGFERHHMQIVLMQRVLKAVPASKQLLGPALVFGIPEDPPLHVFGFYHEYPEAGDEHMIYLGAALLERQRDIAQQPIFPLVEK